MDFKKNDESEGNISMLSFESDYTIGAHEKILSRMQEMNMVQQKGYGADAVCESAKEKIRKACACEEAQIHFLVGGTQANAIVTASMLARYEGVVAARTGHVSVHEAGAIEYAGHKVLEIPGHDGKVDAGELSDYLKTFWEDGNHEHMVFPGMVYISYPTEYGTLYSLKELKAIAEVCRAYDIPLYLDGARLGYGLMSREADVTLQDIARYCDVFYIGGTKVGALFGEAVVFTKKNMPKHFLTMVKQQGGLLAKGWLLGLQFDTLFTDGLYEKISKNAIDTAELLKEGFRKKGYEFFIDSPTNQQFILMDNETMERLKGKVAYSFWEKYDEERTVVRFATSWATRKEDVEELCGLI